MSTVAKIFVVLNLALAVAFLGASATFLGYLDSYKTKYEGEQTSHDATKKAAKMAADEAIAKLTDVQTKLNAANTDLTAANNYSTALKGAYAQLTEAYGILNASLSKANSALDVAQKTIQSGRDLADELTKSRETLKGALDLANDEKTAAIRMQAQLQANLDDAQTQVKDLQAKLADAQTTLQRRDFELETIKRRIPGVTDMVGVAQPAHSGKILNVDNDANIVVISLGSEDGVKVGYMDTVSRGSHYVGQIEITNASTKMSTGRSLKKLEKSSISVGDEVTGK